MIATHLGVVNEEDIDNMSFVFFEDILEQLGRKLTYDAIVNYAGNGFCEKAWDMITEHNPMPAKAENRQGKKLLEGLSINNIKVMKPRSRESEG